MPKKRKTCTGKTTRGTKCKASPLKGTKRCAAHPLDPDAAGSTRFGSHAQAKAAGQLGGRPRLPRPSEIAQQLIERNELALQRPYWRALGYDVVIGEHGPELVQLDDGGAKIYGESKDGDINMTEHDDLGAQMNAAEKLQDRVYGRPKQATEITSPDGGGFVLIAPANATEKSRKAAELLRDAGAIDAAG